MADREITKMHLEIKRCNIQLEQLRNQFKHLMGEHASLRNDLNSWAKKAGILPPEEPKQP